MLLGYGADHMSAGRKEGIVQVRHQDPDLSRALLPQGTSKLVRLVPKLLDSGKDFLPRLVSDVSASVQHARNRHRADAGQLGHVAHACRFRHSNAKTSDEHSVTNKLLR